MGVSDQPKGDLHRCVGRQNTLIYIDIDTYTYIYKYIDIYTYTCVFVPLGLVDGCYVLTHMYHITWLCLFQ